MFSKFFIDSVSQNLVRLPHQIDRCEITISIKQYTYLSFPILLDFLSYILISDLESIDFLLSDSFWNELNYCIDYLNIMKPISGR